ncbi:MAG TPA: chemotaxis protein CheX [Bryobacteraceae bacterium]|nr:chemotaxis protein CheX [Bryobacteraceae bacterium]
MLVDSTVQWHKADLEQVVASVFSTMMGIAAEPSEAACPASAGLLTAAIYLTGEWRGAAFVHCFPRQACEFASLFLAMPAPETVDDDVRDVMGELANMIAGNLKCTLCPGIRVSVPSVVDGYDYCLRVCGGRVACQCGFETPVGPMWITLVDTPEDTGS